MYTNFEKNNICYHILGDGKIPLLFLHGWGCDSSIFAPIVNSLPQQYTSILLDFPGHGNSPEPVNHFRISDFAEIIIRLLEKLNKDKVNVIAHSFGARVAIWIASHRPDLVNKLVITGGAGIVLPKKREKTARTMLYKFQKNLLNCFTKLVFLKSTIDILQESLIQKYGSTDYKKLTPNMRETFKLVINEDLTPYLSLIKSPTLLIWGDKDTETPVDYATIMNSLIADSAIILFEDDDHFAFVHQVDRFRTIVEHFFKEAR